MCINCPTLMSGYEMTLIPKRIHCFCVQLWLHKHKQIIQHGIKKFLEHSFGWWWYYTRWYNFCTSNITLHCQRFQTFFMRAVRCHWHTSSRTWAFWVSCSVSPPHQSPGPVVADAHRPASAAQWSAPSSAHQWAAFHSCSPVGSKMTG